MKKLINKLGLFLQKIICWFRNFIRDLKDVPECTVRSYIFESLPSLLIINIFFFAVTLYPDALSAISNRHIYGILSTIPVVIPLSMAYSGRGKVSAVFHTYFLLWWIIVILLRRIYKAP